MHPSEKLLLIAGFGRELYGKIRLPKVLAALSTVVMLAVAAAVMLSALAICGIYATYLLLLSQGIGDAGALLMAAILALFIIIILISEIQRQLVKLKTASLSRPIEGLVESFIDGFMQETSSTSNMDNVYPLKKGNKNARR